MESFLIPTGMVALAEMGDKTQLLTLVLAARFRRPGPLILGILAATLANHAAAGGLGRWIGSALGPRPLAWILGLSFLAMAAWTLVPDSLDGKAREGGEGSAWGQFLTALAAFFLAEMGDKTQVATVALAARFESFLPVLLGTTAGMLIANVPVAYAGGKLAARLPLKAIRWSAAAGFALMGVLTLALRA